MRNNTDKPLRALGLNRNAWVGRGSLITLGLMLVVLTVHASAQAAVPTSKIWSTSTGQVARPGALATDPDTGHVYVADSVNSRVIELSAWGQFVKAWGWGVRDGANELQTCGPGAQPPSTGCLVGMEGSEPGQFRRPRGGMAVDSQGNVYVGDMENYRILKFSSSGDFLWMIGGEVNKGPLHPGNRCTAAHLTEGDTCGMGVLGSGNGEFERAYYFGAYIAVGPGDTLYVGDANGRIQKFRPDGTYESSVALEDEYEGQKISGLAVDAQGNIYTTPQYGDGVDKFDPDGNALLTMPANLTTESPMALDGTHGEIYAIVESTNGSQRKEVVSFKLDGSPVILPGYGLASVGIAGSVSGIAVGAVTAAGEVDIYTSFNAQEGIVNDRVAAYGTPPDLWASPVAPPEIAAQYAASVSSESASVGVAINPRFWADTRYYVEWGTGKCSEGGCSQLTPGESGQVLGGGIVNEPIHSSKLLLSGLQPDTTYHYRFVARSSGGGPVRGLGGTVGSDGLEATFTTPGDPAVRPETCPNAALRTGASASLPNCRAYEMVSPVDKNNGDIVVTMINIDSNIASLSQSAEEGGRLTYTTFQGFGDAQGVPYVSQYLSVRGADGWDNHGLTPPQGISPLQIGQRVDLGFRVFSPDLCSAALRHDTDPQIAPGAVPGFVNVYQRDNCGTGGYRAVTTTSPPGREANGYMPEVQGLSADGRCVVFYAFDELTPDAAPSQGIEGTKAQVYENCGEGLRLVSALPSGLAESLGAAAGTANQGDGIRTSNQAGAVSRDGSRIYWTAAGSGPGTLYLRVNADEEPSQVQGGKCTEEAKACTVKVSQNVSSGGAHFWGASPDGSRALFTLESGSLKGGLYEFNLGAKTPAGFIAGQVTGVLGASANVDHVYFVSEAVLGSGGALGNSPTAKAPNLYLYDANKSGPDRIRFIATLSATDVLTATGLALSPISPLPYRKTSRVSSDGRHAVFMSNASLTGYDNTDLHSGERDAEIYAYDADQGGADELVCVSCNPSGQRPSGRNLLVEGKPSGTWAAASVPPYATSFYGSRAISEDGSLVFFQSFEPLVPRDTNGKADVYQWEAPGAGECVNGGPGYSAQNRGCLNLISSGESPTDSRFLDASADGADVFFTTDSSLLPQDPGLIDVYDARVGGGYPPLPGRPVACEGEACQAPPSAPNDPTPASAAFSGPGNLREAGKPRCRKGKSARKGRCVAKKKGKRKHAKKRANHDRRSSR